MSSSRATNKQDKFEPFPHLPTELRLRIWELAVQCDNDPKVFRLRYCCGRLAEVSVPPGAFQKTCRESYEVYKKHKHEMLVFYGTVWRLYNVKGKAYVSEGWGRKHTLPIKFDRDFVYITGQPSEDLLPEFEDSQLLERLDAANMDPYLQGLRVLHSCYQPFVRQLRNVILPRELSGNVSHLLYGHWACKLSQLKELRVRLRKSVDSLSLQPGSRFQRHCPLHHHDVFPSEYCRISDGHGFWEEKKKICPACDWETGNWGNFDGRAIRSTRSHEFMLTYDASLSPYPRLYEMAEAEVPVVRWVRMKASGNSDNDSGQARQDTATVSV